MNKKQLTIGCLVTGGILIVTDQFFGGAYMSIVGTILLFIGLGLLLLSIIPKTIDKIESKRSSKTKEATWNNHVIKIEIYQSSKFWEIIDFFVYVDKELVAQTNREKTYEALQSYNQQGIRMPKDIKEPVIKNVKSKIAKGFFSHGNKRIPIKVQQKFSFCKGEIFVVTINKKEIGILFGIKRKSIKKNK